jgi:hypothetical protein
VVARPDSDGNVYIVEPVTGEGQSRTLHRTQLRDCHLLTDVSSDTDDESLSTSSASSDNSSDDEAYIVELPPPVPRRESQVDDQMVRPCPAPRYRSEVGATVSREQSNPIPCPRTTTTMGKVRELPAPDNTENPGMDGGETFEPVVIRRTPVPVPRRTTRQTAGQHQNVHHLPMSVAQNEVKSNLEPSLDVLTALSVAHLHLVQMLANKK